MKKFILPLFLLVVFSVSSFAADSATFRVNMKVQSKLKKFDPAKDSVFIRGNFYTGTGNWWETNKMKLADADGDSIYTGTFDVGVVPKKITAFKYVVRGASYGGDHWEYIGDRSDSVPTTGYLMPVRWFDQDSTSVFFANNVTFQVNMSAQIKKGSFNKATDSVVVRGEFNGWGGKQHVLADADGDSLYTATFSIPSWKFLKYKFVRIRTGGEDWESSSDRLVENVTGPTTVLPVVFFNNYDPAHGQVTFRVNMKVQARLKNFDTAKDSVFLRGNFYSGPGNWWETNSMKLSDANGDSIYEGTFDVGAVPKRLGQFKYIMRGATAAGDRWEVDKADGVNKDRTDTISTTPKTLAVVWFNGDSTSVYFDNNITFQVQMREQMKKGTFVKTTDSVVVRGDFNGWGGKTHVLADADGDSIYTGTFNIASAKKIIYKFVKIGVGGDMWPSSPDRVADNLTGPTTLLPVVFFNNYDPSHGQVTFRVNMKVQAKLKVFSPAKDSVFLRGNFYSGPGNWWETNSMKLSDANGDSIYEGTFDVGAVPKRLGQFKYIMRGATAGGDRWEIDKADGVNKDRTDTISTTPKTLAVVWFNGDSTSVYFDNNITFRVNMRSQLKLNKFKKATDSVIVRGDFNGWGGKTHVLADADGDSIYSGVFNVPSAKKIIYKYVKVTPAGDVWPSSPDRVADNLTGPTTMLPLVWFNNDSTLTGINSEESIVLKYELNQNYPNPFNPSTTIKYSIENSGMVSLKVFNLLGQQVATLVNQELEAGHHTAIFNATGLSSGVYFYKIEAGTFSSLKKMVILK
ncbi:MAG: T9SS type A sorting domain-containing protein [Bacteroidota bacterium]